ncbi:ArsR/SmtB family transcription factor [Methanoplanus endosymbiosus]|uniref:ArsR family transcriptional regulator n=1 Tax=Methanoplanus endosymbiosus TaxID=33865 RepID=A0A9E7TJG6_9EURY|nr:ArsR family transcriptional regulator [Methanoplanus endosymbiosus]UUX91710.1 ArsR family transcriptional regulator [Methanoplanus endosymbiosus]
MLDGDEVSRLLDILGNRNRRRIIQLLRQKPCFVTEISDRLMISPKAVIEHLQMMERESILISHGDEINRRKYYHLSRDFRITVNIEDVVVAGRDFEGDNEDFKLNLFKKTLIVRKMVKSRDEVLVDLDYLERDLEKKIRDLKIFCKEIIDSEAEFNLITALAGYNMSVEDLEEFCGISGDDLMISLGKLTEKGIVERSGNQYKLCGNYET